MKVNLQIDGKSYEVTPGRNLLETCLALGFDLPYFCYHPAMGSVGACRQCAVKKFKDANDKKGRIVMSCMEPVTEGMIISIEDPEARAFRKSIIEGLMLNHPHDCPVCDEGGECHLQDMTVMTGHNYRRTTFRKRTYRNQYLGPFINHEMNRCIQCYRCVRFYRDYAGGKDFGVFGSHDHVYFGRFEEGKLESEFSGNLVEVCPTGVFTDKTLREHYTRKWDLTYAPSVCPHCSAGCNLILGERYGTLRRVLSRYNGSVNGYFICDRGRFGYEFVNDENRLRKFLLRTSKEKPQQDAGEETINSVLATAFSPGKNVIGIGSPEASLEANFALHRLVGEENFYAGLAAEEDEKVRLAVSILQNGKTHSPSLKEIEKADAVLILGEDIQKIVPMAALAVRQAARTVPVGKAVRSGIHEWQDTAVRDRIQDQRSPVFLLTPEATSLDEIATDIFRGSPEEIAGIGSAVAALIKKQPAKSQELKTGSRELAGKIAAALTEASNALIITGTGSGSTGILKAAAAVAESLSPAGKKTNLSILFPESNTLGLGLMDPRPFKEAAERIRQGNTDTLVILENDLYERFEKEEMDQLFDRCRQVVVLHYRENESTGKADIVIPAGTFAESEGTLVNHEGRAQRFYQVFPQGNSVKESWRRIGEIIKLSGIADAVPWETFDELVKEMAEAFPVFAGIREHIPDADYRMLNSKLKRQTSRYSGRTAMNANIAVSEPAPPQDPDTPFTFTMEGEEESPPSSLVPFYWVPGWNSCQAINFYLDEPDGHLKGGDPGIRIIEPDTQNSP
ncbi:MAG TPA: NADH-quinone oxidoreductase subunit NuoG [Bacteroidales bacterium]|nr:NADH-quinone oxidoreductase subunit NuoG [Bacteroidales bacterium]